MVMKPWRCKTCGAHLGKVRRNGSGIHQLLMYREAVDTAGEEVTDVDVIAVVEGYVADVRCSNCGGARTWIPGREAMIKLLEGLGVSREQFEKHLVKCGEIARKRAPDMETVNKLAGKTKREV